MIENTDKRHAGCVPAAADGTAATAAGASDSCRAGASGTVNNQIIAEHWNKERHELPGFDCIVYASGNVTVLDCYSLTDSNTGERELFCRPRCDTTIDSVEKYAAADWSGVGEWARVEHEGKIFIGGDGFAMGNMGFIAHIDADGDLIWGIFFWNTNPIRELSVTGSILSAINEHSEVRIEINIENITEIAMTVLRQ
jgi:hypothetical protein